MPLRDAVRWARPEHLWTDIYTGQDPRCVRVIPVEALRRRLEYEVGLCSFHPEGMARMDICRQLLAELGGLS